jgi:tetratricopeptide (TPR) repeat protein
MLTDLSVTPFAETIRRLSADRKSGDLQVRSVKLVKTVFFDHGRIVFAASNLKKDRLGEALVALGRITDEDFQRVSALMKGENKKRFGDALVQSGVMDKNELGTSVARQVRRVALSFFEMPEGVAAFEERRCPIPLEYMVSLSIHKLLYDGIKTMTSPELILAGLGNLDRGVTIAPLPPFPFEGRRSAEEKEILELAQRRVTVRRLAWAAGGLAPSRLKTVYALLASGILEDAEGDAVRPIVTMETGTFLLSALQRQPDPSSKDAIRQEVEDELERSANLDKESWLKVARSAPRDELIKALEEKMERYHALREAVGDDEQVKTDIEVIIGRASAMLRLTRQAPPASNPPRPVKAEAPEAPPPRPQAPRAGASEAIALPAPASAPAEPAPESTPSPQASAETSPPAATPPREAPEPGPVPPTRAPEPAAQAPAAAAPAVAGGVAAPGSSNFAGSAQIEHLLMEGEVRMTVSDFANAVQVYAKLAQIAPKVAAYRLRLAIAMTCYPRTAKQAEREFFEAVRLDPHNADIHYQFGLYYKAMKARSRAIAEMRTAIQISPRHKAAREELEALAPKDSALASLKKLFK